jgi:flagellar basal-body rod protein FlgB
LRTGTSGGNHPDPRIVEGKGGAIRDDGNNVEIDAEMGRLNKNTLLFNVYAQVLTSRLNTLRSAISGR